ncbi:LysM peptidoglycan-binding domain-containing protein [Brevibacillus thermoruber]|uniref:LysM peptidoglycan-binding domain-containing protein n=1 Tax=Brevibacillus thermoruber TaxID=33942 RepID=A0A9X3TM50_9BACL|nr:LysM peptidoglycan-binding domain-containing protein [Brevibacillus thermoruber]MDA5106905.1 LysM peptidoglycan-binding domain-containing protein [Brevibacillus thermoruber]
MTKGRSKRKPETVRVRAEAAVHELPPRRLRHKRARLSYKTVLGSGLAVFGTLFLTLVVVELYQAHQTQSVTAPLGKNETAQEERAADGQASEFAHADGSAAPPTPPAGSTAVGGGEGQPAAATTKIASSGSLPDGSSSTGAKAVAGAAAEKPAAGAAPRPNVPAEKPTAGAAPRPNVPPQNPTAGGATNPKPAAGNTNGATTPASSQPTSSSGAVPAAKPAPKAKRHVVQKGDTLYKLSRLYYGNNGGVTRIAGYNGLSPEAQLKAGDVLTIPLSP